MEERTCDGDGGRPRDASDAGMPDRRLGSLNSGPTSSGPTPRIDAHKDEAIRSTTCLQDKRIERDAGRQAGSGGLAYEPGAAPRLTSCID